MKFNWASEKGALLALPRGASRKKLRDLDEFRIYAENNATSWFAYARARRRWATSSESSKTLYLVTCCVKTAAWNIATCSGHSNPGSLTLKATAPFNNTNVTCAYQWQRDTTAFIREGPQTPSNQENQCVFIRGFKITLRNGFDVSNLRLGLKTVVGIEHLAGAEFQNTLSSGSSWNPLKLLYGSMSTGVYGHEQRRGSSSKKGKKGKKTADQPDVTAIEIFPERANLKV